MKKLSALLVCLAMLVSLLEPVALAVGQTEAGQIGMEAYVDANGKAVYATDGYEKGVLPFDNVREIVRVTDTAVFLTAQTMEGVMALFAWSPLLSEQNSSILISAVAGDAVYVAHDDAIYFLNADNTRQLMKCEPTLTTQASVVRLLPSADCALREAMDGLNVSLESDGEVYYSRILDAATGMMRVTQFDPEATWTNFGDFETQITSEGGLELRLKGETTWHFISYDNVIAQTVMDGKLYYLMQSLNGSLWLASYDPANAKDPLNYVNRIDRTLQPVLCAGDGYVFVIDTFGTVQAFEPGTSRSVGSWYAGARNADIKLCADKLLVYDEQDGVRSLLLKQELPWKAQKTYVSLTMGSRGEDVRALQERLNELGYTAGRADGVFGANTRNAVIYFEDAVGMTQDGVASPELQQKLFAKGAPVYQQYVELSRGGRTGIRVRTLQERLRELGYQADAADGVYGLRTQTAVSLFQTENGLRATGVATVETQRRLMSGSAAVCSSYILLRKGDSGVRVVELQERLRELGYMVAEAKGDFDGTTADAVRLFCKTNGLREQTQADEAVQQRLFSRAALPYDGYIEMRRGDSGEAVRKLQARLAELGYFSGEQNGVYGSQTRDAVRLFQQYNSLTVDGVAGVETQERLYSRWAIPFDEGGEPYVPPVRPTAAPTPAPTPDRRSDPTAEPTGGKRTPLPWPTETPAPDEQNIDDYDLEMMLMWMNENYYGYGEQEVWEATNFITWLQFSLYLQEFLDVQDYIIRQDGIYDLATKNAVEAFQRFYEIGKDIEDYPYGVADGETLQLIWEMNPDAYK